MTGHSKLTQETPARTDPFGMVLRLRFTTLVDCGYQLYGIFQPNIFREALMMFNVLGCGLMNNYRGV